MKLHQNASHAFQPNAMLLCDFYKISHKAQYPQGTEVIYSVLTPRSHQYLPYVENVVSFGFQALIMEYFIHYFNTHFFSRKEEDVLQEYTQFIQATFNLENESAVDNAHIRALHQLGYLPLEIKAMPEGEIVPIKVPLMTIENTQKAFFWLTNYFETLISCQMWLPLTSASVAHAFKKTLAKYGRETCDNLDHLPFQSHDFSMRSMSSLESAYLSGMGHLLSFVGTDTIPAIQAVQHYYGIDDNSLLGCSIPATEHSVMSAHGMNELETFRYLIEEVYPRGMVSIVSDTYDFWQNITHVLPTLKTRILQRDGKLIIRPDSGDPVEILCGINPDNLPQFENVALAEAYCQANKPSYILLQQDIYEVIYHPSEITFNLAKDKPEIKGLIPCLWDIFGGELNQQGYKVLDRHIGAIYGDSISYDKMHRILQALKEKGFASSNIVFGVGSLTYQYHTRDSLGFAVKCTSTIRHGVEYQLFKDPKTDKNALKKSQKGRVKVVFDEASQQYRGVDGLTRHSDFSDDVLRTIFKDGRVYHQESFNLIRQRLSRYL
ncbi:hypothetical protein A4G19_07455 [Pasteurellaceae bacterium Macca]|nr:hypothetical protein [Pasteurellaceae bacterium Macca]